jgi:hypothetical protein
MRCEIDGHGGPDELSRFLLSTFLEIGYVDWSGVDWIGCCAVSYLAGAAAAGWG